MSDDAKKRKEEIARLKGEEALIRQAYLDAGGKALDRHHNSCLACSSHDAWSFHETNGRWQYKCHSCGASGTIVDVVMMSRKCESGAAIDYVLERYGSGAGSRRSEVGGRRSEVGGQGSEVGGRKAEKKKELKTHADPDSCFEAALWVLQQREPQAVFVRKWVYQRANCEPFGQVARFEIPREDPATHEKYTDKEFRPIVFVGTGWKLTAKNNKGEKWPMYRANHIEKALKSAECQVPSAKGEST